MGNRGRRQRSIRSRGREAVKFAAWLDTAFPQGYSDAASTIGVTVSAITNWRNGHCKPGREHAITIERLSKGAVPVMSWR